MVDFWQGFIGTAIGVIVTRVWMHYGMDDRLPWLKRRASSASSALAYRHTKRPHVQNQPDE